MKNIELLSPARNADIGIAAVNCGADAVYIAAQKFGARKEAGNEFSEIDRLIQYAHLFKVKVYLTLNTILKDEELDEAVSIINKVWNIGIDGLIIQDFGLLECDLPAVPLIASTQTDNRSAEKISFLEKCGFSRVILPRELSLHEISLIRQQTSIELESFVHGSLCVSYSGQCWASAAITGRSANRGECAQICRPAFDLEDSSGKKIIRNKHLLSLKDLNLHKYLLGMINAGIGSFKIEGRLKDIGYVKNITAFYRQNIDLILESDHELLRPSSGKSYFDFTPDPYRSFNRGYTSHFIEGRQGGLCSFLTQKSLGKQVGKVIASEKGRLKVEIVEKIHNADGLCYFDRKDELQGFQVNSVELNWLLPDEPVAIDPGTILYRNLDQHFQREMENNIIVRKISVEALFTECPEGFRLTVKDENHYIAQKTLTLSKDRAKKPEQAENLLRQQLSKSGDTPFEIKKIEVEWVFPCFLQFSTLNALRRDVLAILQKAREKGYTRHTRRQPQNHPTFNQLHIDYSGNVLNSKSKSFYLKHGVNSVDAAFESCKPNGNPPLMKMRYCIKYEIGICPNKQKQEQVYNYTDPLYLRDSNRRYLLEFDCKVCEMKMFLDN
jgi:23S rRNA 5-hydroxycytidine C2501 synthase